MKTDRFLSFVIAAALTFLLSFGSTGCLVTGFGLGTDMAAVALVCGLAAIASAFLAGRKWGGGAILGLLTAGILFFCFNRTAQNQLNDLIRWISDFYHRAYGWSWLWHGEMEPGSLEYPLGFLGILVAAQAGWTIVRRGDTFSAVLAALLPVGTCLVVTDTVPREGYLYLLLLGLLLLILTAGMRRSDENQANTLTLMAVLPLALALWGLFQAVPQESYVNKAQTFYQEILLRFPNLTGQVAQNSVTGGDGEAQVDLRSVGPLRQRYYPVMDVVAPVSGTMYLRGQDYDGYDGTGWTATPHREEILYADPEWMVSRGTVTIATARSQDFCYIPYYSATGTRLTGGKAENPRMDAAYGFAQWTLPEGWRELAQLENAFGEHDTGDPDSRYLELPEDTRAWAEEQLDEILPEDVILATDKAEAIAAYVRESAEYSVNTPKMPGNSRDFVRWFLTESDTGYCTHFASAAAVLLRAAGVPSRYVTGYMFQSAAGVPVTVRADKAHAWVEYYEERLGIWLVLEATPAMEDAPRETGPSQPQTTDPQQTTGDTLPEDTVSTDASEPASPDGSKPAESTETPTAQNPEPGKSDSEVSDGIKKWMAALILGSVSVAFVWGQRRLRLGLRQKKAAAGSYNQRVLAKWQELELLYRRLGKTPPDGLEVLAQKARFSQHRLTAGELQAMDAGLAEARALCREKPWHQRLIDRWVYAAY